MRRPTWRLAASGVTALVLLTGSTAQASTVGAVVLGEADSPESTDVVVVFQRDTPLATLGAAVSTAGATVVEWRHRNAGSGGGFYSLGVPTTTQVANYRAAYADRFDGDQPEPFAVRVRGNAAQLVDALASEGVDVQHTATVPSGETVYIGEPEEGGEVSIDPEVAPANVTGPHPWQPDRGMVDLVNDTGVRYASGNLGLTFEEARGILQTIVWDHDNVGGQFKADWAYEHDFKLYNPNNMDLEACPGYQRSDFWAYQMDGIAWDSNLPDAYLDTGASDKCTYHDITVGSYNPTKLQRAIEYWISMTVAQGDTDQSAYQLRGEVLDKDCEFSAWCVGIGGYQDRGDLLVGVQRGVAPGCRTWIPNESTTC